jgi:outer membrane protein assembly factor BamB
MNLRDSADRFSHDIDQLLYEAGLTDPGSTPDDYTDLLKLARRLVSTDLSRQSKIRYSLRRRLLSRMDHRPVTTTEIPGPLSLIKQRFKSGQIKPGLPAPLFKSRVILATLAGLILFLGLIGWASRSDLPVRQKWVELLAQVLAYLPSDHEVAPHRLALRWQFRGEGGISSPPAAANGLIYAGSNAGYVYALDAQTGQEVWRFQTGGGVNLAPTAAWGLVYAVSEDGQFYALDSHTGLEKWRFKAADRFSLGPTIAGETVFVGAADGVLYALDARTAQEKWRFKAGNALLPNATVAGQTLYVGSQDHYLYALALETGQEKWRFNTGDWLSTAPIEVAGLVYAGSYDENLYVLDARTCQEVRRYNLGRQVRTSATLAGGIIYFASYDSYLHAVDGTTGEEKWRFKMDKQTLSSPCVVEGVVYIGGGDGYLYAVNAQTGAEVARYGVDSQIYTAPVVAEGTIYFVSGKGELYAVGRATLPSGVQSPTLAVTAPAKAEPAGFQFTPGGWYAVGQEAVIRFQGRMLDGAGHPVNGVSVQADNGARSLLSLPSGPSRWRPNAKDGAWEIVIPAAERDAGWWWLTVVRYECSPAETFEPQCRQITRLSESVKVKVSYPAETVINADWTCQWDCKNFERK